MLYEVITGLGTQYLVDSSFLTYATIGICSTAGTAFLMRNNFV